jgi:myo-inositol-1(or 4)-monophosphatase
LTDDLKTMAGFGEEIAFEAGKILLNGFRSENTKISYKSRTNLVTNIDKESEAFLFDKIKVTFPGHTIIAEEGSRTDKQGDFIWYVDPLDATNNFAHGIPFFCISIGVFSKEAGKVIAGIVYDPYHKEVFKSYLGGGAFLNSEKIHVSTIDDIGIGVVSTGFPYNKSDVRNNNSREFSAFLPKVQGVRRLGSAALDLSYVACGRIEGYWEPGLSPWDTAGGSIIVEEAGGIVSKYNNEKFDPEFPQVVASNGKIHKQMLEILKSVD